MRIRISRKGQSGGECAITGDMKVSEPKHEWPQKFKDITEITESHLKSGTTPSLTLHNVVVICGQSAVSIGSAEVPVEKSDRLELVG